MGSGACGKLLRRTTYFWHGLKMGTVASAADGRVVPPPVKQLKNATLDTRLESDTSMGREEERERVWLQCFH